MENFHDTYTVFFKDLKDFVDHLLTQYRQDSAPAFLQDARLVLSILPENDSDFRTVNEKSICDKVRIVMEVTRIILDKVDPLLKQEAKKDFQKESRKLEWRMGSVMMGLASLQMQDNTSEVSILSAGIGGSNTGVRRTMNYETFEKLHDMCTALYKC